MIGRPTSRFFSLLIVGIVLVSVPLSVLAQSADGNLQCTCQMDPKKPRYCPTVSCVDKENGFPTPGMCVTPGVCRAKGATSPDGKGMGVSGDLAKGIVDIFKGVLDKLMQQQGGSGSGSGSGSTPTSPSQVYPACVRNEATGTVSPIPCLDSNGTVVYSSDSSGNYTGTTGGGLSSSVADSLLNSLSGNSDTSGTPSANISDTIRSGDTPTETGQGSSETGGVAGATQKPVVPQGPASSLQSDVLGDVRVGSGGATIYASSRDAGDNSEVAGFYGSDTFSGSQSETLAGRLCASRPWAGEGIVSSVIPDSFFDGICQWRGYRVGGLIETPYTPTVGGSARPSSQKPVQEQSSIISTDMPQADIWADPATVRLGTRTYIFWNAKGVQSCIESGPSFTQSSLSGGASTVPISDASEFTISCTGYNGSTITDSVTVNLAI